MRHANFFFFFLKEVKINGFEIKKLNIKKLRKKKLLVISI